VVLISLLVFFSQQSRVQPMPMQADVTEEVEPNKTTAKNEGPFLKTPFTAPIPRSGTQTIRSTRRLEMATFSLPFSDDGIFGPAC
jgi:hypothetical protein